MSDDLWTVTLFAKQLCHGGTNSQRTGAGSLGLFETQNCLIRVSLSSDPLSVWVCMCVCVYRWFICSPWILHWESRGSWQIVYCTLFLYDLFKTTENRNMFHPLAFPPNFCFVVMCVVLHWQWWELDNSLSGHKAFYPAQCKLVHN